MKPPAAEADKDAWRRWAATIAPVGPRVAAMAVAHLRGFLDGRPDGSLVLGYAALGDEVDIAALLGDRVVALPRLGDDGALTLHLDEGPRERHRFGIDQPPAGLVAVDPTQVDVVLVPGRVFDREGYRLGRGGGHYDRLLPRLRPGTPVVGVTTEARIVDRLPREAHDRPMTHLCTERHLVPVGRRLTG